MERDRRGVGLYLVVGSLIAVASLLGACGNSSDTEESGTNPEADTGTSVPEVSISEECETACGNFMEKCGKMATVTRSDCEIECETEWSEQLANCVRGASVCAQIETCAENGGTQPDGGRPSDGGSAPSDGGDAGDLDGGDVDVDRGGTDAGDAKGAGGDVTATDQ